MKRLHVYVAGPISSDPLGGGRNAILEGGALRDAGLVPFVPHLTVIWQMIAPREYEDWMEYCFAWLDRCDALLRIPGESKGADREVARAKKQGIPVFYDRRALYDWAQARDRGADARADL